MIKIKVNSIAFLLVVFLMNACSPKGAGGLVQAPQYIDASNPLAMEDIFTEAVKNTTPPKILDTLENIALDAETEMITIHFQSNVDAERVNKIYAIIIQPVAKKNLPAILILHGGTQSADDYVALAKQYAKRGYACMLPDLPGITSPENSFRNGKGSSGKWAEMPYGAHHFKVGATAKSSNIYEGITAAIQAFYLLKNQPNVNAKSIGIRGLSWGGYASIITTALLGNQVKAALSVYGSGFYDLPSYFKAILDKMDVEQRNKWLSQLDAGRYASRITAPFYFMAASNDTYFHPPAVMATYDKIKGKKYILFAPNNDHGLTNISSSDSTEMAFFDFYLQNKGNGIPEIKIQTINKKADQSQMVVFKIKQKNVTVTVWYSLDEMAWMKKKWQPVTATNPNNKTYQAVVPKEVLANGGSWYIIATNKNKVSNGTVIY